MKIKPGVYGFLHIMMAVAIGAVETIWLRHGAEAVITSCMDGKHSPGSDHWEAKAIDVRINNVDPLDWNSLVSELRAVLPEKDWFILLEKDHIHISWRGSIEV